jgi:hypothetical protein
MPVRDSQDALTANLRYEIVRGLSVRQAETRTTQQTLQHTSINETLLLSRAAGWCRSCGSPGGGRAIAEYCRDALADRISRVTAISSRLTSTRERVWARHKHYLIEVVGADRASLRIMLEGVRALKFAGVNVTSPYQIDVLPLLDELAPSAAQVGAVNAVAVCDERLVGFNTDCSGFARGCRRANRRCRGTDRRADRGWRRRQSHRRHAGRQPGRPSTLSTATRPRLKNLLRLSVNAVLRADAPASTRRWPGRTVLSTPPQSECCHEVFELRPREICGHHE